MNITNKNIIDTLSKTFSKYKEEILSTDKLTGIDKEHYEVSAEILGNVLGRSVWFLLGDKESQTKTFKLSLGDKLNVEKFIELGYERVERVWSEGDISILGDVVIIYPFSMRNLVRISLFDDEVELIDIVEVESRKKIKSVKEKIFLPSNIDLLVGNEEESDSKTFQIQNSFDSDQSTYSIGIKSIPGVDNFSNYKAIAEIIRNFKSRNFRILYITNNIDRFEESVEEVFKKNIDEIYMNDHTQGKIFKRGFVSLNTKVLVLTDLEVLGEVDLSIYQDINVKLDPSSIEILKKIIPGDYLVHEDHGIGRFIGVSKRDNGYYIEIAYAGLDRLFVPLSAAKKLTKFIGAGKKKPILTGLNSGVWKRISQKAQEKAEEIAKELLQLYALRETSKAETIISSESDMDEYWSFVNKFEFKDTDDQLLATRQILEDFQKERPMDRLLVGDVGFGKTEIAMRAIYPVVNAGYQVAVLAPTTILVEQHASVFRKRFKDYPYNIATLSRFSSEEQKKEVLRGLESGVIDIVIGTHSLLSESVKFKELGLLVIDEEQKFGVKQKEKIKASRVNTNVLSLTATPIPRTLNMALSGIRDISVLAVPPEGRKEIKNHFEKFSWDNIKEAVQKELGRQGQVYFLHNRVGNIQSTYEELKKLFPQARIDVAHGQMSVQSLSKVMSDFVSGNIDILICTTIIENGLDIPTANTLIIDDSSRLGLSQMYQIRGRIGRSKDQAYAYFFYDSLLGNAELRLDAIKESQSLGSGFLLSNRDLEIRGAGDILGRNQSGVINSVGYGLYTQMLSDAVEQLRENHN